MRPKIRKTHTLPTFDSLASCSASTGIPLPILKQAKKSGCTAFRNSRVELGPLLRFLFQREPESGVDWKTRLLAAQAKLEELKLQEREESLVPMSTARKVLNDVLGPLKTEMMSAPATMAGRCNPGDPDLARIALADWVRQILTSAADAVEKVAPE